MYTVNYVNYKIYQKPISLKLREGKINDNYVPDKKDYVCTYQGRVDVDDCYTDLFSDMVKVLDYLFEKFNLRHPKHFGNTSLSVGDVIKLDNVYFCCMPTGWKQIINEESQ